VKKTALFGLTLIIGIIFISAPVFAGSGCGLSKKDASACAKICGIKTAQATEAKADKTDGKLIGSDAKCDYTGKCDHLSLNISGMTCAGCENTITTALNGEKGVIRVVSVDYKSGQAMVCFDPDKVKSEDLAAVVTKTGYKAEIIPATAMTTDAHAGCPYLSKSETTEKTEKTAEKNDAKKQDY